LERVVVVGDRGMLTKTQIDALRARPGIGWLSALRSHAIRKLIDKGYIARSLFDEVNLAEISSPNFPGERLVACYNPILAERRDSKRKQLLAATEIKLKRIAAEVGRRTKTPLTKAEIGLKVGRVLNKFKVGKHFTLTIDDNRLEWQRKQDAIEKEAALDGIYVIRTSEPADQLSAENAVRSYKQLADVEQVFRWIKSLDILVRPIRHRLAGRVRAHVFLCMLVYFVEWHLKQAWSPLLFVDEHLAQHRADRDPVASAKTPDEVQSKKATRENPNGEELHSFRTLIAKLGNQCRNTCEFGEGESTACIIKLSEPTPTQTKALELVEQFCSQLP